MPNGQQTGVATWQAISCLLLAHELIDADSDSNSNQQPPAACHHLVQPTVRIPIQSTRYPFITQKPEANTGTQLSRSRLLRSPLTLSYSLHESMIPRQLRVRGLVTPCCHCQSVFQCCRTSSAPALLPICQPPLPPPPPPPTSNSTA